MKAKTVVNPIIDWTDQNIWQFIGEKDIQVCELYQCGYNRFKLKFLRNLLTKYGIDTSEPVKKNSRYIYFEKERDWINGEM